MITMGRREKCPAEALGKRIIAGALRARQTRSRPLPARWKGREPRPAKPLPGKAVLAIQRVAPEVKMEIPVHLLGVVVILGLPLAFTIRRFEIGNAAGPAH